MARIDEKDFGKLDPKARSKLGIKRQGLKKDEVRRLAVKVLAVLANEKEDLTVAEINRVLAQAGRMAKV